MSEEFKNYQDLFFLGPKGEQRKFFQEMIELINNDVIFWRRNFWPKDPPAIPYRHLITPVGQEYQDQFIQSLMQLLSELKMDVPFFSPRYVAHMTGDLSLPALVGYYAGLVFNSNNVSAEASPVTLKYELEVGRQFARLFGFDDSQSFGHITSGGTVANFESLFYAKNARFLPASIGLALKERKLPWPSFLSPDLWKLVNIPLAEIPELINEMQAFGEQHSFELNSLIEQFSLASLGDLEFWQRLQESFNEKLGRPVIITPATAHYSWSKGANLLGIGRRQCLQVKVDEKLCLSPVHLKKVLKSCEEHRSPIIQTIAVLGSTEYGSFDPLVEMLEVLNSWKGLGLYSPLHIDAAYGGYFNTMFVAGKKFSEKAQEAHEHFGELAPTLEAIKEADSITVDPHKLGHTPYGAGVFITKHGFTREFIAEKADYCLAGSPDDPDDFPLGKYILEGSKPGASAASVYFSHQLIPLNSDGYGGLLYELMHITKRFEEKLLAQNRLNDEFSRRFEFVPITNAQSNLLCFYVRPRGETSVAQINEFNQKLISKFFPRPADHIQEFSFYVSKTSIKFESLWGDGPLSLQGLERDTNQLKLIRLVFLNRWFEQLNGKGVSYMDDFIQSLKKECLVP